MKTEAHNVPAWVLLVLVAGVALYASGNLPLSFTGGCVLEDGVFYCPPYSARTTTTIALTTTPIPEFPFEILSLPLVLAVGIFVLSARRCRNRRS